MRFVEELVARFRRAGATGELIMRFDSGFWSTATLERLEVGYAMGLSMVKSVVKAVEGIDEADLDPDRLPRRGRGRGRRVRLQGTGTPGQVSRQGDGGFGGNWGNCPLSWVSGLDESLLVSSSHPGVSRP